MDVRVQQVLNILNERWPAPPSVTHLAANVGLAPSRLEHLFRRDVSQSIRAYVRARRMLKAAEMLTRTHERISTIAFSIGFNDISNFNHSFKKHFGQSPREFRRGSRLAAS